MEFQNMYLGSASDWKASDVTSIDAAITRGHAEQAAQQRHGPVLPGASLSCDPRHR
jgi:hypothetical protein